MLAFERKLNLLIAFPSTGTWVSQFGISLCNMMCYLMAQPVPGWRNQQMRPMEVKGSILSRSRLQLVKMARDMQCSHILWADVDQDFPKDTVHRLLAWKKPVVACNIATKKIPASPTARSKGDSLGGEPVYTDLGQKGLEEVWRIGCGVMLMEMAVFEKIGLNVWGINWAEELQDYQGEDWTMCQAVQAAGYKIYIDHGLSQEIGHWGMFRFTHDVVGEKVVVEDKLIGER